MAAAEKGLVLRTTIVDIRGGENRRAEYLGINPAGTVPALQVPSGEVIADSLAICEFMEEISPDRSLLGTTPLARALARTCLRQVECDVVMPITLAFRASSGRELFRSRLPVLDESATRSAYAIAQHTVERFDAQLDSEFIAGDALTLADLRLCAFLDFGLRHGFELPRGAQRIVRWFERMRNRSSAAA
jgi:glutathione S-transferase